MKKSKMLRLTTILAGSLLTATMAFAATDYSAMTNEELATQRTKMTQATVEERNAFQNEWQKRVQQMSPEEKQKAMNGQGQGMRTEKQERNQERMQQRQEQGYGMGGGMGSGSGIGGGGMGSGMGGSRGGMGGGMGGGGRR